MKAIAGVLIVAALGFGSGCARSDWIERTLVTVDVTGTWSGTLGGGVGSGGSVSSGALWFELEQQGSTVKGSMQYVGAQQYYGVPFTSQAIDGIVAGDVFRFRVRNAEGEGELTVSGDEMTGPATFGPFRSLSLRRVDPSSRPPR